VKLLFALPSLAAAGLLAVLGCSSQALEPSTGSPSGIDEPDPEVPLEPEGDFRAVSYPAGPYGTEVGSVIANLSFMGWSDPVGADYDASALERVSFSDFYDPDGEKGVEVIVVNSSAVWCTVCQAELADMKAASVYSRFREAGAEIIGTLFEDAVGDPATPTDLTLWGKGTQRSIAFPLVLDPGLKMGAYFTSDATPLNLVIDARTMRILHSFMGYDRTAGTGLFGVVETELANRGIAVPAQ
jgi:hypothetical protein